MLDPSKKLSFNYDAAFTKDRNTLLCFADVNFRILILEKAITVQPYETEIDNTMTTKSTACH